MNKPLTVFLSFIIISSLCFALFSINNVKADNPSGYTDVIWLLSDIQATVGDASDWSWWSDTLNDSSNLDWERAMVVGDMVDDATDADWDGYIEYLENYSTQYNGVHSRPIDSNQDVFRHLAGNHEYARGSIDTFYSNCNASPLYYTWEYGNLLFIMVGTNSQIPSDYMGYCWSWFNNTVQNNQDKNIIVGTHHPVDYCGVAGSYYSGYFDEADVEWLCYNYDIALWVSGHTHSPHSNPNITANSDDWGWQSNGDFGDTTFVSTGGNHHTPYHDLVPSGDTSPSPKSSESWYFCLNDGSTSALLKSRNHSNPSWQTSYDCPLTLPFAFDAPVSDSILFISINGLDNTSQTIDNNRTFIWNKIDSATIYQLQVSNSSGFGTTFIDLDNISEGSGLESMPGGDYSENATHVTFLLPYAYNITYYGNHYYRVRAYTTS